MTRIARTLVLSTFILLMSAIVGHIVNVLLAAVLSFPKASIYAPLDSIFTFVAHIRLHF